MRNKMGRAWARPFLLTNTKKHVYILSCTNFFYIILASLTLFTYPIDAQFGVFPPIFRTKIIQELFNRTSFERYNSIIN